MNTRRILFLAAGLTALTASCSQKDDDGHEHLDLGGSNPHAWVVADGLMNPSSVTVGPDGGLTVCDTGHGRVLVHEGMDGSKVRWTLDGFPTQHWKKGTDGAPDRYKLGPLSAIWMGDTLVVSNSGLPDGEDHLVFVPNGKGLDAATKTNGIGPTTDDEADKGEGNFVGLAVAADGKGVWACGQGYDGKTWICQAVVESKELGVFVSSDEEGIETNSPMKLLVWDEETILVLYSGTGGEEDGLLVAFDVETRKPKAQWNLPGVADPMGMARVPDTDDLLVVDNNWALASVNAGTLSRVTLPDGGGDAKVAVIADKLMGPTDVCIADGVAYVTVLGEEMDSDKGRVVAIEGY